MKQIDKIVHHSLPEDEKAVEAALAAERPLLLMGDPGVGKTHLARAVAQTRGWGFRHRVIDSRTSARDLKWTEDLVARLADAQMIGALGQGEQVTEFRKKIELRNYINPDVLWWGFDWESAYQQAIYGGKSIKGGEGETPARVVVLIDEIDKAENELPNGLLEALGTGEFPTPTGEIIRAKTWPLVIVTSNNERRLPDAFIRRCVVHFMSLPENEDDLIQFLIARGRAHFPHMTKNILELAAEQTAKDRAACVQEGLRPLPGQAEYLDLLRIVSKTDQGEDQEKRLADLSAYVLRKHVELRR